MNNSAVKLSEYLAAVQAVVRFSFEDATWVKAEIRSMSSKTGHYYFELAEKDQSTDKTIATCRATLWKSHATRVIQQFKAESGIELARDLSVLVKVKASFSPQYGFSLSIEDIDSSYTLGDLAQKYQDALERLTNAELIDLNRRLPPPFDINQVLVIAPENAAGLGDFQKDADRLAQYGVCEFSYAHATFQGLTAASSIQAAVQDSLTRYLQQHQKMPDLLVIIRGGGAVNDLAYLNDYALAAFLCILNVPIWVGIGHERDRTLLDEIAHRSFDTPSKVIAGIRQHIQQVTAQAQQNFETIYSISQDEFKAYKAELDYLLGLTQSHSRYQLQQAQRDADWLINDQKQQAQQLIRQARQHAEQLMREILLQSPKQTLARGYAIVRVAGKPITSIKQLDGQPIHIEMSDGEASVMLKDYSTRTLERKPEHD